MSKYIDVEKLKSIIKVQIKERKEWMKDIDRSNRQDQLWSDLNGEDMSILQIIDSLQQEQPEKSTKKNCNSCPHCVDRKDQFGWHFKGCFGGPYNGKFIAEIDKCPLQQEQPDKSLEEAAYKYSFESRPSVYGQVDVIDAFIAGAEWMAKQEENK